MHTQLLSLLTRTPLHVGAGASVGAIDQPVIRERHTRFPSIPGSSLKGVLSDLWKVDDPARERLFGTVKQAGKLLIGEGRLLAFPVRSAKGCFAWLTCPLAINRFVRDSGGAQSEISNLKVELEDVLLASNSRLALDNKVIFEEYPLAVAGTLPSGLAEGLQSLCADAVWHELPHRLAVVSDELFAYFAENACEVAQHIRIDNETGTVAPGALFNQENVPSETLFYAVVQSVEPEVLGVVEARLVAQGNLLQLGADETTGLGWCSVKLNAVK